MFLIFVPYLFLNLTLLVKHGTLNIIWCLITESTVSVILKTHIVGKKINKLVKVTGMFCSSTEFPQAP